MSADFNQWIRERNIGEVECLVSDMNGIIRGKVLPAQKFIQAAAESSLRIPSSVFLITVTGGMSVDPDDVTPAGIRAAGGRVVTYGVPMLPGAMFMLAYIGQAAVLGLPGCVMYHGASIFDVILPRVVAGEALERRDFIKLAHGGLCVHCQECKYPDCGFGKGG